VAGFSGTLATKIVQLKPFDPESKGIVERANGYLETSFLPGRRFSSPADFNRQLAEWLPIANRRTIRSLGARPVELVEADRAAMLPLPPIAPTLGHRSRVRLGRDYYVRVAGNDYSVDPTMIGRMVEINAGLEEVLVTADSRQWARHQRVWATRLTVTDPFHVEAAARLRTAFARPNPDQTMTCSAISPTTTARSVSTSTQRPIAAGRWPDERASQANRLPCRRAEGAPDR
jgi:hypothetical protein